MSIKLEVGKTYLNGIGGVVKIIKYDVTLCFPYIGNNDRAYTINGESIIYISYPEFNLFTEHNPEDL